MKVLRKSHKKSAFSLDFKYISKKVLILSFIVGLLAGGLRFANDVTVKANTPTSVNVRVDYLEEIIVVTTGTGNSSKFYLSTDGMKSWELIEPYGAIDLSTFLSSKETEIYFKGNKDTAPVKNVLQGEDGSFKPVYQVVNGEGRIVFNTNALPVEYRNGTNGPWRTAINLMATSMYEMKGTTLYLRTTATASKRAGRIVSVKIPKKPSAPSVKLDGSKLLVSGLKIGQTQYRVGDSTAWINFTSADEKATTLDIASVLFPETATANTPIPAGIIEFRTKATEKKVASSIKIIEIPAQVTMPDVARLDGTTLLINDPDTKKAYEYTKVDRGNVFNISTAKWTAVTSARPVIIKNASVGDRIIVRIKSTTNAETRQIIPASTYRELTVSGITLLR